MHLCEVGATITLLVCNNEIGFQKHNIDSICSVGRSTKKKREGGYIGEKCMSSCSNLSVMRNGNYFGGLSVVIVID